MKKRIAVTVVFILTIISCKKNNQISNLEKIENQETTKSLSIKFNFKTNKADVFKIMMNNIEVDELQKKNIHVFEYVAPSNTEETILAEFDDGNISKDIVFNLGSKEIKQVELNSILILYGGNEFNINSIKKINEYIRFNKFIERDTTSNRIKTKIVDGKHNPSFSIKRKLINKIIKD